MGFFKYWYCCFQLVVILILLYLFIFCFVCFLVSFYVSYVFPCFFSYFSYSSYSFSNCCKWEGGVFTYFLLSCFFFFSLFFSRGKVILILLQVRWGIHLLPTRVWHRFLCHTLIILLYSEAYNSFVGGWEDFGCN